MDVRVDCDLLMWTLGKANCWLVFNTSGVLSVKRDDLIVKLFYGACLVLNTRQDFMS